MIRSCGMVARCCGAWALSMASQQFLRSTISTPVLPDRASFNPPRHGFHHDNYLAIWSRCWSCFRTLSSTVVSWSGGSGAHKIWFCAANPLFQDREGFRLATVNHLPNRDSDREQ